jgi:hypothetical protein
MQTVPGIVRVLIAFLIVLLLSRRLPLWLSLFVGSVVIGTWFGLSAPDQLRATLTAAMDPRTVNLLATVGLILVLSRLMDQTGQLRRMAAGFESAIGAPQLRTAALPALIGLLPMPGGAILSAPMVEASVDRRKETPEHMAALNYWFRHVWEFWWPLYPGVILAMAVTGVEEWRFMAHGFLLSPFAILGGWFFILRRMRTQPDPERRTTRIPRLQTARELSPIASVILGVLLAKVAFGLLGGERSGQAAGGVKTALLQQGPIFLGLGAAILSTCRRNRLPMRQAWRLAGHPMLLPLLLLVLAIMVFRGMLDASHAMEAILADLTRYRIPPLAMIMVLPFLGGMITGIAVGFVGTSFPLVVTLIAGILARAGGAADPVASLPYATLAFAFGWVGMILSPLHACLILTRRYFNASLWGIYRYLIGPSLTVAAGGLALWWLMR